MVTNRVLRASRGVMPMIRSKESFGLNCTVPVPGDTVSDPVDVLKEPDTEGMSDLLVTVNVYVYWVLGDNPPNKRPLSNVPTEAAWAVQLIGVPWELFNVR